MKHITRNAAALLATTALTIIAVPLAAQATQAAQAGADLPTDPTGPAGTKEPQAGDPTAAEPDAAAGNDVVVTGSRVISNGNNSPTPVTVVTAEQLQTVTPTNIPDGLNRLPIFSGSRSQTSLGGANLNQSGNFLNLRGVGIIRTLILFDGHRVPGTSQDGLVDTNTIPQLLLQRVDVVTGGASAVYGSDAVTGVVNFVVDKKFVGVKTVAQAGISQRGDNASQRLGIAGGVDLFGGRGHFEASYEFFNSDGIGRKTDRRNGALVYSEQGAGTVANPFHLTVNTRNANFSYGGLIRSGPLAGQQFAADGVLAPFVRGAPTGSNNIDSGGDGTFSFNSSLSASLRSHQGFARFDYDLADSVQAYAQVSGTQSDNYSDFGAFNFANVTIASQNAFLPTAVRTALGATPTFTFGKTLANADPQSVDARTRNLFAIGGLTGEFGGGIKWDISYGHSETTTRVINVNNVNSGKLAAALDAVRAPDGSVVCNVTLTNPGLYPGCVPINVFGPTAASADAIRYIREDTRFKLTNRMDDIAGSITASPFSTWAGPVRAALSGEYRHMTLDNITTAQSTGRLNCTGLRYNCTATTALFTGNLTSNVSARQSVTEGAFEVDVPVLNDSPLLGSLNVNGAVRYTHYTTSGNATTWKIGLDYHPTDDFTLRATRSQDIRAPTLNDLFAPVSAFPTGFTDIHTNTSGTVPNQSQGNPNLVPEKAQTLTLGGVYRPAWLPGFSVAVDVYKIEIDKAIANVGGNSATTLAQCEASGGSSPLCQLYVRPLPFSDRSPANYPTLILTQGLNVASLKTRGVDAEVNYATPLGGGRLSLRGLLTYQPKLVTVQFPGAVAINAAGAAGVPSVKATAFVHYDQAGFGIDILQRWHNATRQSGNPQLVYSDPKVPAAAFTDLTLSYQVQGRARPVTVFATVQNLLDKEAPVYASSATASSPGFSFPATNGDDVVGRQFTVGVRTRF